MHREPKESSRQSRYFIPCSVNHSLAGSVTGTGLLELLDFLFPATDGGGVGRQDKGTVPVISPIGNTLYKTLNPICAKLYIHTHMPVN